MIRTLRYLVAQRSVGSAGVGRDPKYGTQDERGLLGWALPSMAWVVATLQCPEVGDGAPCPIPTRQVVILSAWKLVWPARLA